MRCTIAYMRCHFGPIQPVFSVLAQNCTLKLPVVVIDEPSIFLEEEDSSKLESNRKPGLNGGFVTAKVSTSRSLTS